MNRIATIALVFLMSPGLAGAQDVPHGGPPPDGAGPPGPSGTPDPQRMAAMRQMGEQMRQLREQTRAQMLSALTPRHRTQLASLIGEAAISPNPDPRVVAQRIDALLSPAEAQSVVNLAASERVNARNLMESDRAQFEASMPADQRAAMEARHAKMAQRRPAGSPPAPDAGRELLRTTLGFGGGRHGGPGGPGGPMGGPHQ